MDFLTLMYLYCSRCIIREETEVQYALNDILSSSLESRSESKLPRCGCCWRPQDGVFPFVARSVSMVLTTRNTNSGDKNRSFFLQKFVLLWSFFVGLLFVFVACLLCVCVCVLLLRSRGFSSRRDRDPHFDCLFSLMSDHLLRASKFCFSCIDPFLGVVGFLCSWVCIGYSGFWFCQSFRD